MGYKQTNNPISRKTSPLRDKGDHPHTEEGLHPTSTSMHEGEEPSPQLTSGDMSLEPGDYDYEDPNYKTTHLDTISKKKKKIIPMGPR